jgi:hypothetical protein
MTGNRADENLMMCHEVAYLFLGSTTETVATWARRGRVAEVRTADGKPGNVGGWPRGAGRRVRDSSCQLALVGDVVDDRGQRPVSRVAAGGCRPG